MIAIRGRHATVEQSLQRRPDHILSDRIGLTLPHASSTDIRPEGKSARTCERTACERPSKRSPHEAAGQCR